MWRLLSFSILLALSTNLPALDKPQAGDIVGRHLFGLAANVNGDPLLVDERPLIYAGSQFDLPLNAYGISALISGFGDTIGAIYVTSIDKETQRSIDTVALPLGELGGISKPRGGVVSPWNTVLFGEAAYIDAAEPQEFIDRFKPYFNGKDERVHPYHYGWVDEAIVLNQKGDAKLIKNYALGRVSASQLEMMPDGKTLYLFDQDNHGLLYLFVSDAEGSLVKGSLYGITLEGDKLHYEALGNTSALKMKFKLKRIAFKDLFDSLPPQEGSCAAAYTLVKTPFSDECLKPVKKNRRYAGLFEPSRTLALKLQGGEPSRFSKVTFTPGKVELTTRAGDTLHYPLTANESLGSQYIIQGTK